MSSIRKTIITAGFILILLMLGTTDALLTRNTIRMPGSGIDDGIAKMPEPAVFPILQEQGFAVANTTEPELLQRAIPVTLPLTSQVLLLDNDRVATIAWVETPEVKNIFTLLRRQLRASFTAELRDLIDETQTEPGKPPRDVVSFFDPGMNASRLVFVRVRQRLYELHVTPGKEAEMDRLVNALSE